MKTIIRHEVSLWLSLTMLLALSPLSAPGENYVWRRGVECGFLTWFGDLPAVSGPFLTNLNHTAQTTHWTEQTDLGAMTVGVSWNVPMTLTTNAVDVPITVSLGAPGDFWTQMGWPGIGAAVNLRPTTSEGLIGYGSTLLGEDWVNGNHLYHYQLFGNSTGVNQFPSLTLTNGMRLPEYRTLDVAIRAYFGGLDGSCTLRYAFQLEPGPDSVLLGNVSPAPGQVLEHGSLQSFQAEAVYRLQSVDRGELQLQLVDDAGNQLAASSVNFTWRYVGSTAVPLYLPNGGTITVPTNTSKLFLKAVLSGLYGASPTESVPIEYPVVPREDRLSLANVSPTPGQRIEQGARQAFRTDVTYALRTRAEADLEMRLFTSHGLLFNSLRPISEADGTNTVSLGLPETGSVLLPWGLTNLFLQVVMVDRFNRQVLKESAVMEYTIIPSTAHTYFIFGSVLLTNLTGPPLRGVTLQLTGAAWQKQVTDAYGNATFTNLGVGQYVVTPLSNGFPGIRFDPTNALIDLGNPTNHMNRPSFVAYPKMVVLRALEAVQVIQNWSNNIPLVAEKPTLVRAHLQLAGTNTTPILVEDARLLVTNLDTLAATNWAARNGRVTLTTNDCSDARWRSNINASLNFELPALWCRGRLDLSLEWTNGMLWGIEPAEPGGIASNCAVRITFTNMPDLSVRFIRIGWTNSVTNQVGGVPQVTIRTNLPSEQQLAEQRRRLLAIYPVARLEPLTNGYFFWNSTANGSMATNESRLLRLLENARQNSSDTNRLGTNRIWYGVVADQFIRGLAYLSRNAAVGDISDTPFDFQRNIAPHEIGHVLGRPHPVRSTAGPWIDPTTGLAVPGTLTGACWERANLPVEFFPMHRTVNYPFMPTLGSLTNDDLIIWGYDHLSAQVISPFYYYELMSYCASLPYPDISPYPWISQHTYNNLLVSIANRFTLPPPPALFAPLNLTRLSPSMTTYLLVRGEVGPSSNALVWLPFYTLESAALPEMPPPGDYTLRGMSRTGTTLWEVSFQPDLPLPEYDLIPNLASFSIPVPLFPDLQSIVILHGEELVASRLASANAPLILGLQPQGGETYGHESIRSSWFASDLDGDPLHFLVQVSHDGGQSWLTLAIDATSSVFELPPDTLSATSQGLIRVQATDGFRTSQVQSQGVFTIQNHPPIVSLVRPTANGLFYGAQTIVFEAQSSDFDEGTLSGASVQWRSDRDGLLGTGDTLMREALTLSEGRQVISVTATDSAGLTNMASVIIHSYHTTPPILRIRKADQQAVLSWPASLTNYVLESSPDFSTPQWISITTKPVVAGGTQSVTVGNSGKPEFYRLHKQ